MKNFRFQNSTQIIFGKDQILKLSNMISKDRKIMVTFGGGSVKANGVYDQVITALKDHNYVEFWGIEPNPTVQTLRKAVELGKSEGVDFILAVGGGSVLDGSKLIACAIPSDRDAWDIVLGGAQIEIMLPYASVITLPATGSEMNDGAVISNTESAEKFPFHSVTPQFSILDPQVTYTLPQYQVACGVTDTYIHTMEQYLTKTEVSPLMDRWSEGIFHTLIETAPNITAESRNYDDMANYMLSATMALNGFTSMGVAQDWATHMIGHEITALTGLTHGNTLAIVMPALMSVMREQKGNKILQYGERIFGIVDGDRNERIDRAIEATEAFFRSLGLKTRLSENGIGEDVRAEVVARFKERDTHLGEEQNITYDVVERILELAK